MKRSTRSLAGPGDRGETSPTAGSTWRQIKTGPGCVIASAHWAVQSSREENSRTDLNPQALAMLANWSGSPSCRRDDAAAVACPPVTS